MTHTQPSRAQSAEPTRAGANSPGAGTHAGAGIDVAPDHQVVVGDRGRIVLPAALRAELGLHAGSRLLLSTEPDGSVRLRPFRSIADANRGLLSGIGGGSMVDELIAERRAASAAEDAG
jgi:AbrB family looped-hinge helix DNA binding protein